MENNLNRYSVINNKNKREIVLLIGSGCKWKKCTFCDYHTDFNKDVERCFEINKNELNKVTGIYKKLEVINSGSFVDLDSKSMNMIEEICLEKGIDTLHFECHWAHICEIPGLKKHFEKIGINVKLKIGVESFDYYFRESYLNKGINTKNPKDIKKYFDEVCLLQGIAGQSIEFMLKDISIGLRYFDRICINIMKENSIFISGDVI